MSTEQGMCPFCRTDQPVKRDGTLAKHLAADEVEVCEGWNKKPVDPGTAAREDDTVTADTSDDWDDDEPESEPAVDDADRTTPEPGPRTVQAPADDDGSYRWQMTVKHPAIYLGDPAWHHENALAAALAAERAGHTVTGEAQWAGDMGGGHEAGTVLLTYRVPVG